VIITVFRSRVKPEVQGEYGRWAARMSDRAQRLLMRGMDLPDKTDPAPEAPRARYRPMRFTEWLSRVREIRENGIETNLPPC
jgi:hypothetical protein